MSRDPLLPEDYGHPRWRVLGGAGLAALTVAVVVMTVPAWRDRAAYLRATPCSATVREDCVVDRRATITGLRATGGRSRSHEVTFLVDGREQTVELADPDEVWGALRRGADVDVRMWGGDVTRVAVLGRSTETDFSPKTAALEGTAMALLMLGGAVLLLVTGVSRLRWARTRLGPMPGRPAGATAGASAMAAGAAMMLVTFGLDVYDPPAVFLLGAVAACVPAVARRVRG